MRRQVLMGFVVAALLLLGIGQRIHMIMLGYEIEQLKKTHRDLERVHQELMIERETLSSLDRIERIAIEKLGMIRPQIGQIIQVDILPGEDPRPRQTIKVVRKEG